MIIIEEHLLNWLNENIWYVKSTVGTFSPCLPSTIASFTCLTRSDSK